MQESKCTGYTMIRIYIKSSWQHGERFPRWIVGYLHKSKFVRQSATIWIKDMKDQSKAEEIKLDLEDLIIIEGVKGIKVWVESKAIQ